MKFYQGGGEAVGRFESIAEKEQIGTISPHQRPTTVKKSVRSWDTSIAFGKWNTLGSFMRWASLFPSAKPIKDDCRNRKHNAS